MFPVHTTTNDSFFFFLMFPLRTTKFNPYAALSFAVEKGLELGPPDSVTAIVDEQASAK